MDFGENEGEWVATDEEFVSNNGNNTMRTTEYSARNGYIGLTPTRLDLMINDI